MSSPSTGAAPEFDSGLIDALFARHGIRDRWLPLPATGVANCIYATRDVVLRVATDYPDAIPDARTESVAAPVARAAGILTPRLIAFDDTRTLVDRPFSLWERVHGETMGLLELDHDRTAGMWRQVGRELARLHQRVTECPDPDGYLDDPGRPLDLGIHLDRMATAGIVDRATAGAMASLISELEAEVDRPTPTRFVHDDIHSMNIMCTRDGELLALIDWGDAGWGDPTLDFVAIPLASIPDARAGYEAELPGGLGPFPEAHFVWDKLHYAMRALAKGRGETPPVDAFRRFLRDGRI